MSTHSYYSVSKTMIFQYYNLIGIEIPLEYLEHMETEYRYLEDMSPFSKIEVFSKTSLEIDKQMQVFINRMCTSFGYDVAQDLLKQRYYDSFMGILKATTCLNLMGKDNYALLFERINSVMVKVLEEINAMSIDETCLLYGCIRNADIMGMRRLIRRCPYTALFSMLAVINNSNIADYRMFANAESSAIDLNNLTNLVRDNLNTSKQYTDDELPLFRLSYLKSLEMDGGR